MQNAVQGAAPDIDLAAEYALARQEHLLPKAAPQPPAGAAAAVSCQPTGEGAAPGQPAREEAPLAGMFMRPADARKNAAQQAAPAPEPEPLRQADTVPRFAAPQAAPQPDTVPQKADALMLQLARPPRQQPAQPPRQLSARFAEEPLLALRVFRLSATLGLKIEEETLTAALAAAPGLAALRRETVRDELNNALTGRAPAALAPLAGCGGLAPFGIDCPAGLPDLTALGRIPAGLLCRWWAFFRLTGAPLAAAEQLALGRSLQADIARLDALFLAGPPRDRLSLKRQLAQGVPLDYAELAAAFAALDAGFESAAGLYAQLLRSGEPFRPGQLAITEAGLLAEGVRPKRLHRTHRRLLDAVVEQPSLNSYPVLAGLARQMQRYL